MEEKYIFFFQIQCLPRHLAGPRCTGSVAVLLSIWEEGKSHTEAMQRGPDTASTLEITALSQVSPEQRWEQVSDVTGHFLHKSSDGNPHAGWEEEEDLVSSEPLPEMPCTQPVYLGYADVIRIWSSQSNFQTFLPLKI